MRIPRPACAVLALSLAAAAQTFSMPAHFQAAPLPGTFSTPVGVEFAPDGSLFVIEKPGKVRLLDPAGVEQGVAFIDLVAEVNNDWDRGLLGLALHPGWVPDGGASSWVYLLYTVSPVPPADNGFNTNSQYSFSRLTRWRALSAGGVVQADLGSRQVLLGNQLPDGSVPDGIASVHNSHSNGELVFAPDGTLLFATGDGAHYDFKDTGGNDNPAFDDWTHPTTLLKGPTPKVQDSGAFRAQDLRSLAGKVLRLDPHTGLGLPSNPFWDGDPASFASRTWALGLRNPFRMTLVPGTGSSDPSAGQPGVVMLGDVGWNLWEEVNVARFGGENFGWPCYEGFPQQGGYQNYFPTDPSKVDCDDPVTGVHTDPALAWHHSAAGQLKPPGVYVDENGVPKTGFAGNCAIGGAVYAGGSYPAEYGGRLFFADYVRKWIKTIEFDGAFNLLAVRDFASDTGGVVDIEAHPLTGDLHVVDITSQRVFRIAYGANLAPVAQASAAPLNGPAPLVVQFDGSASFDPDPGDTLAFDWDFGDGTPHGTGPAPSHAYQADGLYDVELVVTDPLGLSSAADGVQIAVGNAPPVPVILTPAMGEVVDAPSVLQLSGAASDPDGGTPALHWTIDLYHDIHVHPAVAGFDGPTASFPVDDEHAEGDLTYYRVALTATDAGGLSATAEAFVYPSAHVVDVAGTARPISRMDELVPPEPTGGGNHDIEVARDGVSPAVGSAVSYEQFDTYHGGAQGNDDWIGYELLAPPGAEFRFTGLSFQEGKHFVDGGWFESWLVEVRTDGAWSAVDGLVVTPDYPFALSAQAFFDGVNFQTYQLEFTPAVGDAVRLRGNPGGTAGFLSAGELRARAVAAAPPQPWRDITADASAIVSKVDGLFPPGPYGNGNKDKQTIRNGSWPPPDSESWFGQYDTFHGAQQGTEDWVGYEYPALRSIGRLLFQEGRDNADGGAFDVLGVQVQSAPGGAWTDLPGVTFDPPYPGANGVHYETFELLLPPALAAGVRLAGDPAGAGAYVSVGELRVFEPVPPDGCGWETTGAGLPGANTLTLASDTPPLLGLPIELHVTGATASAAGALLAAPAPASLPFKGGTLLVSPAGAALLAIQFSPDGTLSLLATLPPDPALEGTTTWLQAAAFTQPAPWPTRLSNALKLTLCSPAP
jgi:glucose/arabinose dehydrogenase